MMERLELKNFTAFKNLALNFSTGINVIIGENGTGKTHLLKAAYALCAGASLFRNTPEISEDELEAALTLKLIRIFLPLDDRIDKLYRLGAADPASLSAWFAGGSKITATFFNNSKALTLQDRTNYEQYQAEAVFIPTKEVLAFMKGFNSLYQRYELSFDQTYQDICLMLDLPRIRPENLHEKVKWAMAQIKDICGGRFVFHGGGKVTFKTEDAEYSANSIAEGFRKAGTLSRLLETGAIEPGASGPLFWDEPDSNLNPKLMELLVHILLELSRIGQQVILTTHDYVFLKWFDILMDKSKNDHVRFHTLHRDIQSGDIKIGSTDDYRQIEKNPITEAFNDLTIAHAKSRLKEAESA